MLATEKHKANNHKKNMDALLNGQTKDKRVCGKSTALWLAIFSLYVCIQKYCLIMAGSINFYENIVAYFTQLVS